MPRVEMRHRGIVMDTWPTIRMLQRVLIGGVLLFAATTVASGVALGTDTDNQPIDTGTQATWLHDHFRCEHPVQMAEMSIIDPATQAARLHDHFCCEHGVQATGAMTIDAGMQAVWFQDHFQCEHGSGVDET